MTNCSKFKAAMKPPFSYYGGKQLMAAHILPLIPEHDIYVEPFCGGAAIFFGKEPSTTEVLNDANKELINFYQVLQQDFVSLEKELAISLYSRDLHRQASVIYNNPDMFSQLKRAWAVYITASMSFGRMLDGSWGYDRQKNQSVKAFRNKLASFNEEYAIRLQNVQIECRDALLVIQSRDTEKTFHYIDPPYIDTHCGHYDGYSRQDYDNLLSQLATIKGRFLLSSFETPLLKEHVKRNGWHQKRFSKTSSMTDDRRQKVEVLTANYRLE